VTLEELAELAESGQSDRVMISMSDAVAMPTLYVGEEERKRVSHGRSIEHPEEGKEEGKTDYAAGALAKVCDKKNQLIAIAELDEGKILWRPRVVLID
jgi:hypothetical protein